MLHFHKAELVDAQDIAALINSAYRGESSRAGWTTEADILDGLRTTTQEVASIIKREDAFVLVGVLRDQIVATICCEKQDAYGRNIAHLGMIAVKPTLQNKGHGATMIQAAEAMTAREWRVVGFHMAVITLREELIAFYERLGYVRSGEFKNFPENSALWQPKVAGLTLEYLVKIIRR
ncbi:MAG: GNAT family N-acetyltransferase [Pseudomonadota bacterium]